MQSAVPAAGSAVALRESNGRPSVRSPCPSSPARARDRALAVLLAALVAGLLAAGCGSRADLHAGRYESGFETSAFYPCGSDEQWWVTADSAAWARLHAPPARIDSAGYLEAVAFVRLRGRVSPPGEYGHVGAYDRELRVSEVLEVRAPEEGECP